MTTRRLAPLLALLMGCNDPTEPLAPPDFLAGRDFWPNNIDEIDFIAPPSVDDDSWFASDSIAYEGQLYVILWLRGAIWLYLYNLDTGELSPAQDAAMMRSEGNADSPDHLLISNIAAQPCRPVEAQDQALTLDEAAGVCRLPHIGVDPDTLSLTRDGEAMSEPLLVAGVDDGVSRSTDGIELGEASDCEGLSASYSYSVCSLQDDDPYRCPISDAPDAPLGACGWWMLFEGESDRDNSGDPLRDRALMLAHARTLTDPWVKWIEDGGDTLTHADARVSASGPHGADGGHPEVTFASVPDIWWDPFDEVWRVWITVEASTLSAQFYTDSPDDGLSWGITRYARNIDCYDAEAGDYDADACVHVAWEEGLAPPNDPDTPRTPDAVDFAVYDHPEQTEGGNEVAVMITAANSTCADQPREGAFLFAEHPDGGDQSSGELYSWVSWVRSDPETGLIVSAKRDGVCDIVLHDFNITRWDEGKYVMFFTQVPPNGVHVAGSGFACSNYSDDDGDGLTDYGFDPDCQSPTDDSE